MYEFSNQNLPQVSDDLFTPVNKIQHTAGFYMYYLQND